MDDEEYSSIVSSRSPFYILFFGRVSDYSCYDSLSKEKRNETPASKAFDILTIRFQMFIVNLLLLLRWTSFIKTWTTLCVCVHCYYLKQRTMCFPCRPWENLCTASALGTTSTVWCCGVDRKLALDSPKWEKTSWRRSSCWIRNMVCGWILFLQVPFVIWSLLEYYPHSLSLQLLVTSHVSFSWISNVVNKNKDMKQKRSQLKLCQVQFSDIIS